MFHRSEASRRYRRPLPCLAAVVLVLCACSSTDSDREVSSARDRGPGAKPQVPWFEDATKAFGIDFVHETGATGELRLPEIMGGGVALFDHDGDGDLDLYLVNSGPEPLSPDADRSTACNRLLRNEGGEHFVDVTGASGLGDQGYGMGVAVGDIDNDGREDVYVSNFGPDRLYRNLGDGRFEDVTRAAGIDVAGWSVSCAFFDADRDDDLDLFVTQYVLYDPEQPCLDAAGRPEYCGPKTYPPAPDVFLRNNGDGTFTDASEASGIAALAAAGLGVVCEDFDEDGWCDLYVANDAYENHLWINQHDGTFIDEGLIRGAALNMNGLPEAGMGVVPVDYDGDGDDDLFMTHLSQETNTLYQNLGGARMFLDVTGQCGLASSSMALTGFGTAAFDMELDGDPDLLVANGRVTRRDPLPEATMGPPWDRYAEPNLLYINRGGRFESAPGAAPAFCDRVEISRGIATGDIDGDGDIDFVLSNMQGPARLFINRAPREGHWLLCDALDPSLGRRSYGARLRLTVNDWTATRTVNCGFGYVSSSDPRAHFGIPAAAVEADSRGARLLVIWPDGDREEFAVPRLDCSIVIRRGEGDAPA